MATRIVVYADEVFTDDRARLYLVLGIVLFFGALFVYSTFFYALPTALK
jgi:hypothetical protein